MHSLTTTTKHLNKLIAQSLHSNLLCEEPGAVEVCFNLLWTAQQESGISEVVLFKPVEHITRQYMHFFYLVYFILFFTVSTFDKNLFSIMGPAFFEGLYKSTSFHGTETEFIFFETAFCCITNLV